MPDQPAPNGVNGLTGADMLALLSHITGLLDAMEGRIIDRLNENSAGATERWRLHDRAAEASQKTTTDRLATIEADLATVSKCLADHLKAEEDEDLASEIRVRPIRAIGHFLVANWKDILILFVGTLVVLGVLGIEWRALGAR